MDIETMRAYEWALNQNFGSVAAQYAKKLALCIQSSKSATSDEVAEAIYLLKGIQHDKYVVQNYTENDVKNYKLISLAITALQKIGTNTVDVAWTEAYQSYESAGDEAVPYCPKCDADLEDDQKFCKDCGVELIWSWDKEIK
jgi:uncharacterized paraquat-inducible protein A